MTLLEQYEEYGCEGLAPESIRRSLAIAQAVEEWFIDWRGSDHWIMRRADELLAKQKKEES